MMSVRYSDLSLLGRTSHRTCRTGPRLNSTWSRLFGMRNLPFHPYGRHRYFVNSDRQPDSVDPDVGSDDEKDDEAEKVRKALLEVKSADFMIRQNAFRHHTDQYDLVQSDTGDQHLVLRRGDSFDFVLTFNRPYNQAEDNVSLVFETGKNADDGDNTRVVLNFQKKDTTQSWQLMSVKPKGNTVELTVKIPPTCCIGKWVLKVNTISKDKEAPSLLEWLYSKPVYVLFNPWCKEDTVYHPDEQFKKDHLLEEDGGIYVGRYQWGRSSCKDWAFAPFDNPVLECTLKILEKTRPELRKTAFCDASKITRKLTSVINNIDNNGVLNGRWDGQYGDGDSPTSWNGSQAILEQYFKSGRPVKYGQCWVFSGVLTTCLRTLGIPARSVTNTDSAHDTDGSLTIDKYFLRHDSGQIDDNETRDSVWNFHVWNDAWMARPDLVKVDDYDYRKPGWQACDATPQETSDGYYCCGPTPILAVKNGDVNVGFDGAFVFAEVNGDEVYWVFSKSENKYVVKSVHKHRYDYVDNNINNIDNNGVLNGRWDGQYGDGDSPTSWNGSQAILEQYFKSGRPVKYGQCWVFSGVLTTCLRTLGIPARSVTNTDSAHDTDGSLTIDKYFLRHDSGQIDDNETRDSVWNFHVWNDAWMARPDLVKVDDYDYRKPGWQACDATPQETSDGYYCCGPTPILAVKNGDVNVGFDGAFVFAEVNGDEVYWVFSKSENKYVVKSVHKHRVGTGLLTRKGEEMVNVIGDYKHLDAESEKKATLKATKLIPQANLKEVYKEEAAKVKEEIKMELLDTDETLYGDNFKVPVKIINNYKTKKQLYIMLQAESRFYTNASGDEGKKVVSMKTFNEDLKPGQNKTLEMLVEFEDYERYVLEGCIFKIGMFCLCLDDYDFAYEHDTITLSKPTITAKATPSKAKVGDTVKVSVSFQNSLPKTLTQGYLTVEGTGLENRRKIKINKPVQPKQTFSHEVDICPAKEGRRKLLFDFDCNEMKDIKGMCVIEVTK